VNPQTRAHIHYGALKHNLQQVRRRTPTQKILAMVKSNGYGHGLVPVAKALSAADAFGVASLEDGIILREAGITQPIVVMSRFVHQDQLRWCIQYRLSVVIYQLEQVAILEETTLSEPLTIWLKLDTGMSRIGLSTEEFIPAWQRLNRLTSIQKPIILMTHLACADTPHHPLIEHQLNHFHALTRDLPVPKSIANSAAILTRPDTLADWVRPGIMLYGASPVEGLSAENCSLKPAMTLTSSLISVRQLRQGEYVGYGATWQCPQDMKVGVAAIGYGDGYPRHAISGTPVLVQGQLCSIVGRISMDMICIDLRHQPDAKIGDEVTLWGDGLPADTIAASAKTLSYELFCRLTQRVQYLYHE
jgi:alanine racemase